jgi:hypothetical protein
MSLQFTAERSLGKAWAQPADRGRKHVVTQSKTDARARVLPQLTVTGCGSAALNTACRGFAIPAWAPCESGFWWNQGLAGRCMYWSMVGVAPWCAGCTVIAP